MESIRTLSVSCYETLIPYISWLLSVWLSYASHMQAIICSLTASLSYVHYFWISHAIFSRTCSLVPVYNTATWLMYIVTLTAVENVWSFIFYDDVHYFKGLSYGIWTILCIVSEQVYTLYKRVDALQLRDVLKIARTYIITSDDHIKFDFL